MTVRVELPEDVSRTVASKPDELPRALLEAAALEGYRSGRLTDAQVRRLLGFTTRMEVDAFLKSHQVWLDYGAADLERDLETLQRLGV